MKVKAKDFLKEYEKVEALIIETEIEKINFLKKWDDIAMRTTSMTGGERVQSSGSLQKMADTVGKKVDAEAEYDAEIKALKEKKKDIINVVNMLKKDECIFIHKMYFQGYDLQDAADFFGKSYSWATTMHGKAVNNVDKILRKREKRDEENKV